MKSNYIDKDKTHLKYLEQLNSIQSSLFDNMILKTILFNEAYYTLSVSLKSALVDVLKAVVLKPCLIDCKINGNQILTFYSKNYRSDHDGYWNKILEFTGNHDEITIESRFLGKFSKIDIRTLLNKITWFLRAYNELKIIDFKKDRLYMAAQLVSRKWVYENIKKLRLTPKVVMCFFDSSPDENVIMQYFRNIGAITVTNQHGLCVFRTRNKGLVDQSQILNFKCDYFLAKGEMQRKQFINAGFSGNRIIKIGIVNAKPSDIAEHKNGIFGVYLDSPTLYFSKDSNKKMIDIAKDVSKSTGYKYLIKTHPADKTSNYSIDDANCIGIYGKETLLTESFGLIDFSIVHASATYVDSYSYGIRCFKLETKEPFPIAVEEDCFSTSEDLERMIIEWINKQKVDKRLYIEFVRKQYDSGWKENNIFDFLTNLLKD